MEILLLIIAKMVVTTYRSLDKRDGIRHVHIRRMCWLQDKLIVGIEFETILTKLLKFLPLPRRAHGGSALPPPPWWHAWRR